TEAKVDTQQTAQRKLADSVGSRRDEIYRLREPASFTPTAAGMWYSTIHGVLRMTGIDRHSQRGYSVQAMSALWAHRRPCQSSPATPAPPRSGAAHRPTGTHVPMGALSVQLLFPPSAFPDSTIPWWRWSMSATDPSEPPMSVHDHAPARTRGRRHALRT